MDTNLNEIDEEDLFKQALSTVFDEVNKKNFIPDWDKALLELLEQDTLPIISVIHFKFADIILEDVIELRDSKFETFSKNILDQIKKLRTERRKETIKSILETDKGPSLSGLWSNLGLEFWSKMCQIDVQDLKSALPSDVFLEEDDSSKVGQIVTKTTRRKKLSEKICGPFKSLIDFIWGSQVQNVPPRRMISMEEKFKVISYEKLLLPQTDLKEEEKEFGLNQYVKKVLLLLYKIAIKSVGGKWPKTHQPKGEEILNDMLIWVLELDKAQERIAMFKKNMIKREIIS